MRPRTYHLVLELDSGANPVTLRCWQADDPTKPRLVIDEDFGPMDDLYDLYVVLLKALKYGKAPKRS